MIAVLRGTTGLRAIFAGVLLALCNCAAAAYPDKPIRLVVGYPPAGANDLIARLVATKLGPLLNTQVVVDNRAGANGIVACDLVAKSAPDGYTLLFAGMTPLVLNPLTYAKLPYNTLTDFTGITAVASGPVVIAMRPDLQVNNVQELIALAAGNWYAVLGPRNLPGAVVTTLHTALGRGVSAPDSKEKLTAIGVEPMLSSSPAALAQFIKSEFARWGRVVKAANIRSE